MTDREKEKEKGMEMEMEKGMERGMMVIGAMVKVMDGY